jgi:hypothetical protein
MPNGPERPSVAARDGRRVMRFSLYGGVVVLAALALAFVAVALTLALNG